MPLKLLMKNVKNVEIHGCKNWKIWTIFSMFKLSGTCKNTKPIPLGIKCPKDNCEGDVIQRKTKKGRTFYGCSNYPKCDFVSWNKPANQKCSNCGNSYLLEKYSKAKGNFLECPECKTENTLDKTNT